MTENDSILTLNALVLEKELLWFEKVIEKRIELHRSSAFNGEELHGLVPPLFKEAENNSNYARVVRHYRMRIPERVVLMLALIPHIRPELLDFFYTKNKDYERPFTEFGGVMDNRYAGFMPTGETAIYLLSGNNLSLRFELERMFQKDHFFSTNNILTINRGERDSPALSCSFTISAEYKYLLTSGEAFRPEYSTDFPAAKISTQLDWDDLVLSSETFEAVEEIGIWLEHGGELLNDPEVGKKIKRGYRSLFYGPSGTGKTLTACLLGKTAGLDVFRIDLSMVVSKYIGETEKNLAKIFDQAENRNWILFFDEADSLFGKRTQTSSSNDRYANQEVSYLLQRIEDFPGVVILASNYKSNMDPAFMRRFQSIIRFPMPSENLRLSLYEKSFGGRYSLSDDVNLQEVARKYELSGGNITNILRYCAMMAMHNGEPMVTEHNFLEGIRKELKKTGKTM